MASPKRCNKRKDEQELVTPQIFTTPQNIEMITFYKNLVLFLAVHDIKNNTGKKCQLNCSKKQVSRDRLKKGRWLTSQSTSPAATPVVALL